MSSLVQSLSIPIPGDDKLELSDLIRKDIEPIAQKKSAAILSVLRGNREYRFYIRDTDAKRPTELDRHEFHDVKESAVRLPATTEALQKFKRALQAHTDRFHFSEPVILDCLGKCAIIFYTVKPLP